MRFIKKNFWTMLTMIFVMTLAFIGEAAAADGGTGGGSLANTSLFSATRSKLVDLFINVKMVVFIVGGFGLVAVAFLAIFGKVNWKWFAGLATGLAILAAAGMAIQYVVGDGAGGFAGSRFSDTYGGENNYTVTP